ncbi:hypothetical protein HOLleu_22300 [Holothuria leucospilota]|uniref:Sulfotransferase n=1 Tax=Holothuria leucospilota TaxID=206669 RepID=A0A9Q1BYY7_HOLLE|nr:hypothetical protein HOLleu_22300 [Holothuria leucospilota]
MDGCPEGWHLEILREAANNQQHTAQLCRSNAVNGSWKCAPGWQKLSVDPFCIRSSSSSKSVDGMSKRRQPKYASVSHNRKLLFVHVPKAGGTSIQTSFLFDDQRERLGGHYLGGHHEITTFDKQFFKSYHKFCMVRHPCSRLISVSAFYSQDLGNAVNKQWANKFMDNETRSSFDAFVEHTLYPGGPVKADKQVHLRTQVGMLFDEEGQFGLDQVLIFEKWEDSVDQLGKRINANVTILKSTHMNFSRHKTCQETYTSKTWAKMYGTRITQSSLIARNR